MDIDKLDLGGTACMESKRWVSVSLDGTTSGDEVVHNVIADFDHLPFPAEHFVEAFGCCYLEELHDVQELGRVCKEGAKIMLGACGKDDNLPEFRITGRVTA